MGSIFRLLRSLPESLRPLCINSKLEMLISKLLSSDIEFHIGIRFGHRRHLPSISKVDWSMLESICVYMDVVVPPSISKEARFQMSRFSGGGSCAGFVWQIISKLGYDFFLNVFFSLFFIISLYLFCSFLSIIFHYSYLTN